MASILFAGGLSLWAQSTTNSLVLFVRNFFSLLNTEEFFSTQANIEH